ncbi:MAG: hypothetical protein HY235_19795 [Acidobacteria bacterium]|nr:hypothetical protein [Acidobacteriota bacterium]
MATRPTTLPMERSGVLGLIQPVERQFDLHEVLPVPLYLGGSLTLFSLAGSPTGRWP